MAANGERLQGEVDQNPDSRELDVEALLLGMVRALMDEVKQGEGRPEERS